jgi:sugar phosphate isomerase/epimerase
MTFTSQQFTGIDRRQFLGAAAAGVCASSIARASWAHSEEAKPAWKMKLSTSSLHYRSLPLEEACRRIGSLGFAAVDVWSHFEWAGPLCEHLEQGLEQLGPERFAALLQQHNLKLFAASCYQVSTTRFAPLLGQLGGCVVIRGSRPLQGAATTVSLDDLKTQMTAFLESLKPELDLLAQHQCVLAIENHSGKSLLNTLESIQVFTELNQHAHLGIALAPYHIQLNNESVEQAIRAAGDQLRFFYAWEHAEGTKQLPGIGPTDMTPWLQALAEIRYAGYVNPFMHHEPEPDEMDRALRTSRTYLQKISQQV